MQTNNVNQSNKNPLSMFSGTINFNEFLKIAHISLQSLNFDSINLTILNTYNSFSDNQKFNLQQSELSLYIDMIKFFEKNMFFEDWMLFSKFKNVTYLFSKFNSLNNKDNNMSFYYNYMTSLLNYCECNKLDFSLFQNNPVIIYVYSQLDDLEKKKISEYLNFEQQVLINV